MGQVNEVIAIRVEGAPEGVPMRACLVRMEGSEEPWNIFVEAAETDWWLSIGEVAEPQKTLVLEGNSGSIICKLSILLGWGWGDVWDRTEEILAWSQMAVDNLGPKMLYRVEQAKVEDIIAYRDKMEGMTIHDGEVIWQDLTGVPPTVSRN